MQQSNTKRHRITYAATVTIRGAGGHEEACRLARQAISRAIRHSAVKDIVLEAFTVERIEDVTRTYRIWDLGAILLVLWVLSWINWEQFWN